MLDSELSHEDLEPTSVSGARVRPTRGRDRAGAAPLRPARLAPGRGGARPRPPALPPPRPLPPLQQIVTLKFIGFPLRQIKKLLAGADLATALRLQRKTLEEKRRQLDQAIAAIARAERVLATRRGPDWGAFAKIIEAIQMQTNTDWTKQYYSDEAQRLLAERGKLWSPELQKRVEEEWATLFKAIEAAAAEGVDPASARAQALAERHAKLIEAFTGGHAAIEEGLGKLWADQANWTPERKKQVFEPFAERGIAATRDPAPKLLSDRADAFLQRALAVRVGKQ